MSRRLLLIRHGETVWNHEHRLTTRTDVPLSDDGMEQARTAAQTLSAIAIDRIYCSPLQRTRATAEAIADLQHPRPQITTDHRLVEVDAGPFEGMTEQELESGPLAAEFARWHTDDSPQFPDGSEPFEAALARAAAFLDEHDGEPGTTLVVTHGSLTRLIVCSYFLGGPPPLHRHLWLDNCRLAVFEWRGGLPTMTGFNVTDPAVWARSASARPRPGRGGW